MKVFVIILPNGRRDYITARSHERALINAREDYGSKVEVLPMYGDVRTFNRYGERPRA